MTAITFGSKPVRWNAPPPGGVPLNAYECTDHPAVRSTGYMEVHNLLGTSGCSREYPYWVWNVMGVIEDAHRGPIVVNPGDWILEPVDGVYLVLTDQKYDLWQRQLELFDGQYEMIPYRIGNSYQTQSGRWVRFEGYSNQGNSYETMFDQHGHHRYTARDFGRCTGTAHDYSDPGNTPPVYRRISDIVVKPRPVRDEE